MKKECKRKREFYNQRQTDPRKIWLQESPQNCLIRPCCDAENLWCKEADASIVEINKDKWRPRENKIKKKVKQLNKVSRKFTQLLEKAEQEGINIRDISDIKTYEFYVSLFNILDDWHPLQNGMGEIKIYYKLYGDNHR